MHYWLISAPAENGSKEETWKNLNRATSEMSSNHKMRIPELRVGTLDSLMTLSDDLERIDRSGPSSFRSMHSGGSEISGPPKPLQGSNETALALFCMDICSRALTLTTAWQSLSKTIRFVHPSKLRALLVQTRKDVGSDPKIGLSPCHSCMLLSCVAVRSRQIHCKSFVESCFCPTVITSTGVRPSFCYFSLKPVKHCTRLANTEVRPWVWKHSNPYAGFWHPHMENCPCFNT